MKLDRILWGIILLFVGLILLLENFSVIEFYWRNVWGFWPVFLIIAGINILFNRNKSQVGNMISIGVLVITLGFLFYRGQQPPENRGLFGGNFGDKIDIDINNDDEDTLNTQRLTFTEPFDLASSGKVVMDISGGGTSFKLDGPTDSLVEAVVEKSRGTFTLKKELIDSVQRLTFRMQEKKGKWNMNDGGNDVNFKLNTQPEWELNMNMGAGEVDFDLSAYKIRTFKFEGGAAALDIQMGDLLPIADVIVKTGVADVKIKVPTAAGCRIKSSTGLSAKDFTGFTKLDNGTYETPNYATSTKKIFITLDGGLSNFEVSRY
ncbi:hypothetical protein GCM10011387_01210 [Pedobacter quisquiliarum]|uniref:LiaF transmembrane domain-containing protein n=1 Tax=Pedobacter quisquiliarum TaxID=1834438 RepID=A0A916TXT6_9SPHI|nr:DUF5668 domain-containing protein [Pedobacter quisquiliarum]GGC51559.1 hypothetical protein GCM10011387_01210 [Pedobacter quisquiliarum]